MKGAHLNDSATAANPARRRLRVGKSAMPLLAGLAATLLALGLVIGQTIVAQREARGRAMIEGNTLLLLNELMSAMLNGETGQRGYLLTNKPDYLVPYLSAKQRRDQVMVRLRETAARTPEDGLTPNLDRLDRITAAKFTEMDRSVTLARTGFRNQATALVLADFGKMQMDAIRREIARLSRDKADRRHKAFLRANDLENRLLPLIGFLGLTILGLVFVGFRAERSRSLAEAEAEQAAALREAKEQTELLARELNHRVKNLFSVILSIVTLSGRKPGTSREVVDNIRARIHALSLAHSASQGGYGTSTVELGPLVVKTMEPYGDDEGRRVRVTGPEIELPARMVTPLGLIIHELATNAVKYGPLSTEAGTIEIRWMVAPEASGELLLTLEWIETGGPPIEPEAMADARGFGSQMTTLAAGQLGGSIERLWPAAGAVVRLRFPLP